jgi:hypothetical protein
LPPAPPLSSRAEKQGRWRYRVRVWPAGVFALTETNLDRQFWSDSLDWPAVLTGLKRLLDQIWEEGRAQVPCSLPNVLTPRAVLLLRAAVVFWAERRMWLFSLFSAFTIYI